MGDFFGMLVVVYLSLIVIVVGIQGILKMAEKKPGIDKLINRIPGVGKARNNMAMARFCKVYHSCILAGLTMAESAELASGASLSGAIREAGARLVRTAKAGSALGPQFLGSNAFPKAFARSYSTGEEAGTLDKDLERWSKVFQSDAEASAKTLSVMIPKVFYFLVLGFIIWKISGFYGERLNEIEKASE